MRLGIFYSENPWILEYAKVLSMKANKPARGKKNSAMIIDNYN